MREELLLELENEYEQQRVRNEQEEALRKERIRLEQPEIYAMTTERENMIFGTLRDILNGKADTEGLPEKMEALSAQIRVKLSESGFPADYLAPVYRCPICKDTGKTGELIKEPCICYKKAYQRKLREKIGLNRDRKETFETFDETVFSDKCMPETNLTQRKIMKTCKQICENWANTYPNAQYRDIMLMGGTGLGKTFLLRAMAERLIERDVNVLIISAYRMIEMLRKSYFDNDDSASELMEADVLMIDDLGSEPLMQNITVEQLFQLINERQIRGLSTVISTNLTLKELRERYTERIVSRLNDPKNCEIIVLKGKDLRKAGR